MKRVSFKVAKVLRDTGYPQGWECDKHYCLESEGEYSYQIGDLVSVDSVHKNCLETISAPTYFEVWIWLWKTGKYRILLSASNQRWNEVHGIVTGTDGEVCWSYHRGAKAYDATDHDANYQDPEEAIEKAIDYLCDNDLIK